jgi:putative isomerase
MITPTGWNTWDVHHLNTVAHLPTALRIHFNLYDPQTGALCGEFDWRKGMRRLGPHATDGSYCEIELRWDDALVRCEYAGAGDELLCRVTPLANAGQLLLLVEVDAAWGRKVEAHRQGRVLSARAGGKTWSVRTARPAYADLPAAFVGRPALAFSLAEPLILIAGPVTDTAGVGVKDTTDAAAGLDAARAAYEADALISEGWLGDAAAGLTRGIAWNTIWEPRGERICTPVSRDWCRNSAFGNYVLFDWDTFFCAVMAAAEDPALAAANVRAILDEVTPAGFIPNFGSQAGRSDDRSQPPVGAYCVLKLYRGAALAGKPATKDELTALFPVLLRWHAWWLPHRDGNADGLLEWGSDPVKTASPEWLSGDIQAAMYESGLDNSPMYDEAGYNTAAHTMELADVGLNALYALDAWALAEIAAELGRADEAARLRAEYDGLAALINERLWNEEAGIYQNRHWDGRFSPHLSPTLFYPLLAGIAPPDRAARMVREHLLNEAEFWGHYVLPSIARDDPGYGDNHYWRGRVWPPMNFLVSEGLHRYGFDAESYQLARRSVDLFLGEWEDKSHVHENYNSVTGEGDDSRTSDPVYTWGGLLAYIGMQELADAEAWGGWRFGHLAGEPAALHNVRLAEGTLDVLTSPTEGLLVRLNGDLLLTTDCPAIVRGYTRAGDTVTCRLSGETVGMACTVTLGQLPPNRALLATVNGQPQPVQADAEGELDLALTLPAELRIHAA